METGAEGSEGGRIVETIQTELNAGSVNPASENFTYNLKGIYNFKQVHTDGLCVFKKFKPNSCCSGFKSIEKLKSI